MSVHGTRCSGPRFIQTQREEIERLATSQGLLISGWYEERTSAAKRGRPVFAEILRMLRRAEASGFIVYKLDRSARNLKDWADLGELIDQGIPVAPGKPKVIDPGRGPLVRLVSPGTPTVFKLEHLGGNGIAVEESSR